MKKTCAIFFCLILFFSALTVKQTFADDVAVYNVTDFGANGNDSVDDSNAINKALAKARETDSTVKVYVPHGNYMIEKKLIIYSDTVLELDPDAVITRTDESLMMLSSSSDDGSLTGGYTQFHDITIKGGTFFGNIRTAQYARALATFTHGENVTLDSVTFKGVCGLHMISCDGISGLNVRNCTFEDFYYYRGDPSDYMVYRYGEVTDPDLMRSLPASQEALHFDYIDSTPLSDPENLSAYPHDGTSCKNVTVTGCTFSNLISGLGTHHDEYEGMFADNITITDNTFKNVRYYCIEAAAFTNLTVSGNRADGCGCLLIAKKCSGTVTDNEIVCPAFDVSAKDPLGTTYYSATTSLAGLNMINDCSLSVTRFSVTGSQKNGVSVGMSGSTCDTTTVTMSEMKITNSGNNGIGAYSKASFSLTDSLVDDSENYGVLAICQSAEIFNSDIENCKTESGIVLSDCNGTVNDCTVKYCAKSGINATGGKLTGAHNTVSDCGTYGYLLKEQTFGAEIISGSVSACKTDIAIDDSEKVFVTGTVLSDAGSFLTATDSEVTVKNINASGATNGIVSVSGTLALSDSVLEKITGSGVTIKGGKFISENIDITGSPCKTGYNISGQKQSFKIESGSLTDCGTAFVIKDCTDSTISGVKLVNSVKRADSLLSLTDSKCTVFDLTATKLTNAFLTTNSELVMRAVNISDITGVGVYASGGSINAVNVNITGSPCTAAVIGTNANLVLTEMNLDKIKGNAINVSSGKLTASKNTFGTVSGCCYYMNKTITDKISADSFSSCNYAIYAKGGTAKVYSEYFALAKTAAVYAGESATLTLSKCIFTGGNSCIITKNATLVSTSNTFNRAGGNAVTVTGGKLYAKNNIFTGSVSSAYYISGAAVKYITGDKITGGTNGIIAKNKTNITLNSVIISSVSGSAFSFTGCTAVLSGCIVSKAKNGLYEKSSDVTVKNNTVKSTTGCSINADGGRLTLTSNKLYPTSGSGIRANLKSVITSTGDIISGGTYGVNLLNDATLTMSKSVITKSKGYCVLTLNSTFKASSCKLYSSASGISAKGARIALTLSKIYNMKAYGILSVLSSTVNIASSQITGCENGICLDTKSVLTAKKSAFTSNCSAEIYIRKAAGKYVLTSCRIGTKGIKKQK